MILIVLITGGIYILVIASFFYGWEKLKSFNSVDNTLLSVSIIVPMRNEEKTIGKLLKDLTAQDYPTHLFEVVVVDDHSSDRSVQVAQGCAGENVRVVSLPGGLSGKKAALRYGINLSQGEIIMTTDADCRTGKKWISTFVEFFKTSNAVMVIAPVAASASATILEKILSLEMFSLLGSTAGSAAIGHPVMSNGANMAFTKTVYSEIAGIYESTVSSGDDIFALLAMKKKYPGKVMFLKNRDALIQTTPPYTAVNFFKQRGRWVSKSRFYSDPAIVITALVVFATNLFLLVSLLYGMFYQNFSAFFTLVIMKSVIDFPFLYRVTSFFGQKRLMVWFPLVQSIYFLYVCTSVFAGLFMPLGWKGRPVT